MSDEVADGVAPVSEDSDTGTQLATSNGRDDAVKLTMVANTALVGVPAAYAASQSVPITMVAATVAIVFVVAYLAHRHRQSLESVYRQKRS